jgi:hypothetical protein
MARIGERAHRWTMSGERWIHLITDRGSALCGVTETRHWSVVESAVSCMECRALMELRALERSLTERRLAATIARLVQLA